MKAIHFKANFTIYPPFSTLFPETQTEPYQNLSVRTDRTQFNPSPLNWSLSLDLNNNKNTKCPQTFKQ